MLTLLSTNVVRPDKYTDRVAWNKSWEDELNENYERWQSDNSSFTPSPDLVQIFASNVDQNRLMIEIQSKEICILQEDIRSFVLGKEGVEEKWRGLKDEERLDTILTALFTTSCIGPDMENYRKWCPDMTLAKIGSQKGQGFIDLLGVLITNDSRKTPIYFKDAVLDRIIGGTSPGVRALRSMIESNRCYFISLFIWRVLLTLFSIDEEYFIGRPPKQSSKSGMAAIRKFVGTAGVLQLKQEIKKQQKDYPATCWQCGKPGGKLSACSKCKSIGRTVLYCSRECQTTNWKAGIPHPHKVICGKRFTTKSEEDKTFEPLTNKIPPPAPTFMRSLALLHQINLLEDPSNCDYVLMQPGQQPDMGVVISIPQERIIFLVMRNRAMRNGDKNAVESMLHLLLPISRRFGLDDQELARQLEGEYGVAASNSKAYQEHHIAEPTEEEIEWAVHLILSFNQNGKVAG